MPRKSHWPAAASTACLDESSNCASRLPLCDQSQLIGPCHLRQRGFRTSGAAGTTILELVVVLAIVGVLCAIAMPTFQNNFSSMHLSAATSAVTGAIQSTRYAAVVNGCQYQIIFSQGTTTYQLARQALNQNTTPPSCPTAEAFSNLGTPVAWAAAPDGISLLASTTLQFAPNGIVSLASGGSAGCATGALACLKLSNGTTTSTINISGVGNVTVTSP